MNPMRRPGSANGSSTQPREGRGSQNPGRFARRRQPEPDRAAADLSADNPALNVTNSDLVDRARAAGIATKGRPVGEVARELAIHEACMTVGVNETALAAAGGDGSAVTRAIAAARTGIRPDAAIMAALKQTAA